MNKLHAAGPHTQALFHVAHRERTLDARSIVRFRVSPLDRVNRDQRVGIIRFETVAAWGDASATLLLSYGIRYSPGRSN
jgi:hypothetical protein